MKNIVYIIAIILWFLSMLSKSRKKQQQVADLERLQNQNKRVGKQQQTEPKKASRISADLAGVFTKQEKKETATDYESAYASSDYTDVLKKVPLPEDAGSHYRKNYGMASSLGTESSEEKDAYNKEQKIIPKFTFGDSSIKQYIIASEILGKPKALRR
jgi:hypothetical protein